MSGGGTFIDVRVGRLGAAGPHVDYIARPDALLDTRAEPHVLTPDAPLFVRHLPAYVLRGVEGADELRACLRTYAEIEERDEIARYRGEGQCRSHYRITLSWGRGEVPSHAQVQRMADELLAEHFPHSPTIGAVHSNAPHLHASLYIGARQTDGRKLALDRDYLRIDETWNRIYCKATGRDPQEHLDKKLESAQFRTLVRVVRREARRQLRPVTWRQAERMVEAVARRPRPARFADYRALPIHPDAQHAADLARAVQRMEALDRVIYAAPSSSAADAARAELLTFGNQGSTRAKRKQLAEIMLVVEKDRDILAQVRRLVGPELFARADELRCALEQTMASKDLRPRGLRR